MLLGALPTEIRDEDDIRNMQHTNYLGDAVFYEILRQKWDLRWSDLSLIPAANLALMVRLLVMTTSSRSLDMKDIETLIQKLFPEARLTDAGLWFRGTEGKWIDRALMIAAGARGLSPDLDPCQRVFDPDL